MYNIYVTNKSSSAVYFRLSNKELTSVNANFHNDLIDYQTKGNVHIFLVGCGFCLIPRGKTIQFAVGISRVYDGTHMYASLHSTAKLWVVDKEVDYMNFGCLFVNQEYDHPLETNVCYLTHGNPEPVWIEAKKGEEVPRDSIKIDEGMNANVVYLGRSLQGTPCRVTSRGGKCSLWTPGDCENEECGQLLQAQTSHQWLRAFKGDPVPPNAVIVGVLSDSEGLLYLGRVGGKEPCSISTENGKIKDFCYFPLGEEKRVENGELVVLTKDG